MTAPDLPGNPLTRSLDPMQVRWLSDHFAGLDAGLRKSQPLPASPSIETVRSLTILYGTDVSWTQNWPYEPLVGNAPSPSTFILTWASFCLTFLCFGLMFFIYETFLNHPDDAPRNPVLSDLLPLTRSQRKVDKYFLVGRCCCWSRSAPVRSWRIADIPHAAGERRGPPP